MSHVLTKQSWEEDTYGMDMSTELTSSRTISSINTVTVSASWPNSKTDVTVSNEAVDSSDNQKASFKLTGGTDGEDYPIRVRVTADDGAKVEGNATLRVRDGV